MAIFVAYVPVQGFYILWTSQLLMSSLHCGWEAHLGVSQIQYQLLVIKVQFYCYTKMVVMNVPFSCPITLLYCPMKLFYCTVKLFYCPIELVNPPVCAQPNP